ncbi:ETC complex I subunit [Martelella mediterranea]|uniref:ETC complex I subunit-like protein n=1 Tax=Martelella mediterranea TaxID=293089 RepID=A0A4R3NXB1_9HYPH|nr:ETC complex I subunit [Martelella mediterranea]TCT37499.1 ETC complex I subunit-like protein [Martelella mediterranea]
MSAKIYRPARTAMQQGNAKTHQWVLEFDQQAPRKIDPVFGYTSSSDTLQQVKLKFDTRDEAEEYAQRHGIEYRVMKPKDTKPKVISYSDNFSSERVQPWTH